MNEYYAVIDNQGQTGPFLTMHQASKVLRDVSRLRGHTNEQAYRFFLHESSVVESQSLNGRQEFFKVGWLAREESGRDGGPTGFPAIESS